jgi:beta-phosphoglucomutase-like phosphatase (HAD superfamily)
LDTAALSAGPAAAGAAFAAAIFDMDGLLLDSERVIMAAWLDAARSCGLTLSREDFLTVIGASYAESRRRLTDLLGGREAFDAVAARSHAQLTSAPGIVFPLKTGALRIVTELRQRRVPCAVASSTRIADVRSRLDQVGLLPFFQALAGGDEVRDSKPDPAVYLLAASRLGVLPERCLAFEDTDHGANAAHAAGMRVVLIPDLRSHDFHGAFLQLRSLDDAIGHIERWF